MPRFIEGSGAFWNEVGLGTVIFISHDFVAILEIFHDYPYRSSAQPNNVPWVTFNP